MTDNIYLLGIEKQEKQPPRVIYPTGSDRSNRGMDIYEIRLANLRWLAVEAGGRPALARRLDMSYPLLQNYIGKNPTKKIGDKTSRKAEEVFSLGHGWMDAAHVLGRAPEEFNKPRPSAGVPGMPLIFPVSDWPFSFAKDRFDRLPGDRQKRIASYALGLIEEWEAGQAEGTREAG